MHLQPHNADSSHHYYTEYEKKTGMMGGDYSTFRNETDNHLINIPIGNFSKKQNELYIYDNDTKYNYFKELCELISWWLNNKNNVINFQLVRLTLSCSSGKFIKGINDTFTDLETNDFAINNYIRELNRKINDRSIKPYITLEQNLTLFHTPHPTDSFDWEGLVVGSDLSLTCPIVMHTHPLWKYNKELEHIRIQILFPKMQNIVLTEAYMTRSYINNESIHTTVIPLDQVSFRVTDIYKNIINFGKVTIVIKLIATDKIDYRYLS